MELIITRLISIQVYCAVLEEECVRDRSHSHVAEFLELSCEKGNRVSYGNMQICEWLNGCAMYLDIYSNMEISCVIGQQHDIDSLVQTILLICYHYYVGVCSVKGQWYWVRSGGSGFAKGPRCSPRQSANGSRGASDSRPCCNYNLTAVSNSIVQYLQAEERSCSLRKTTIFHIHTIASTPKYSTNVKVCSIALQGVSATCLHDWSLLAVNARFLAKNVTSQTVLYLHHYQNTSMGH